jgi:hypothetical protein
VAEITAMVLRMITPDFGATRQIGAYGWNLRASLF